MSKLNRKPPPKFEEPIEQFKFDIEEYLNKSPITNQFRLDNPNLQPTISNDSKMIGVGYNSLDPLASTPPSPPASNKSNLDNFMDNRAHHNPSSSVESNTSNLDFDKNFNGSNFTKHPHTQTPNSFLSVSSFHTANGSPTAFYTPGSINKSSSTTPNTQSSSTISNGGAFMTTPLEKHVTNDSQISSQSNTSTTNTLKRAGSKLQKFKRFSLNRLDLNSSKKFTPGHKKFSSVSSSMNRLSISSPVANTYSRNTLPMSANLRDPYSNTATTGLGLGLLATKAPSLRSSQSNQSLASVSTNRTINDGTDEKISTPYWKYHVLKFGKDLYLSTNPSLKHMYCRNGPGFYVEITRETGRKNDGFTMVFKDAETQSDESKTPIMVIHKKPESEGGYFTASLTRSSILKKNTIKYLNNNTESNKKVFNGLSIPQAIPDAFIPYDKISNLKRLEAKEAVFKNYEFRDFNNWKWNIGSIPRVRVSKINKLKTKLNDQDVEQWKFIGKNNTYFHQNYVESTIPLPFRSSKPQEIYLQNPENTNFPPVLAMFRPHRNKFSTKVKNFNKMIARKIENEDTPSQFKPNKFSNTLIDNDITAGEHKNYFIAGDGLYFNKSPIDDLPDENKLGWLTIYEDKVFQDKGMFDLVLGLTLAVGYESIIKD